MTNHELHILSYWHSSARTFCTDSRQIQPNDVFFALSGPNHNGNLYAVECLEKGALGVVVSEKIEWENEEAVLVCKDPLMLLQEYASHCARAFEGPIIGITGSNGKTTTKELLAHILKKKYKVHFTQGNLNNHIGVPLTLLRAPKDAEVYVIEMGANKKGDIEELCRYADPDIGLITNIGKAHLLGFGSKEGILEAKTELFHYLHEKKGTILLRNTDKALITKKNIFPEAICFGTEDCDFFLKVLQSEPFIRFQSKHGKTYECPIYGSHNFLNIEAAIQIAMTVGMSEDEACAAVSDFTPSMQRSERIQKGEITVVMDAYNANPDSMKASIQAFYKLEGEPKMLILGDMFELGVFSQEEHENILTYLMEESKKHPSTVWVCGPEFYALKHVYAGFKYFETTQQVLDYWLEQKPSCSMLLLKASRGMAFEKILQQL